jgi:pimeloyl-ACP methyl ester carboxylesterase
MIETLHVDGLGQVELTFTERGSGKPVLLLHGGAGPVSVAAWAELLARTRPARVITPTHPGFNGTPRPEALTTVGGLARVYAAFLAKLGLDQVTVIGNSVGGWIAAELALLPIAPQRLANLVLVDAGGLEVPGLPVVDVFSLPLDELSRLSYHDPARFRIDPSKLPPEAKAAMAGNRATLKLYCGDKADPSLRARLPAIKTPTLVAWGESDGVFVSDYGRAYAQAIPGAKLELLAGAGHMPQMETPELLVEKVWAFAVAPASVPARVNVMSPVEPASVPVGPKLDPR